RLAPGDVFLIGRDNGPDSSARADALAKGLAVAGVNVVMLGVAPSGELYNAVSNLSAHGGAQVTRSHVEININGIKLLLGGVTLFGNHIKQIFDWVEENRYRRMRSPEDRGAIIDGIGEAFEIQRLRYLERYEGKLDPACPVAIDLGGGTAVKYRETLARIFPSIVRFFRDEDDPHSTKGLADPTRLDQRGNYAEAYDFSIANPSVPVLSFDLDADRFGLMLAGKVWKGDTMMLPIYEEQIPRKPGTPVRIDARTNLVVDEAVRRWNGRSICQAIGHSKVKQGMDLDLIEEAAQAGYDDADRYVQEHPDRAETFQGEFSLHLFRFKPELNDEGRYVGTPVDDAIDFACYFVHLLQRRGASLGRPCLQLSEYLDLLREQGIIGDSYTLPENNIEIRTEYDPLLKKNLGHGAYELFRRIAAPEEEVSWIDDGVSVIAPGRKLMLRYSNTSPKVTMKCDARPELWIAAATRLLGVFFAITDYLIARRGMDARFRAISRGENEFLYAIFKERAGKNLNAIEPLPLAKHLEDAAFREALDKEF
ncbi:MAG: hypothetical protein GYA73_01425, partial [Planctomycetes bacterium]|nr:hypothetical protein [Planctomycetota bacterium]